MCPGSVFCVDNGIQTIVALRVAITVGFIWRKNLTASIYQVPTIGWEHSTKESQKRWKSILYLHLGTDLGHQTSTCALKVLVTSSPTHCASGMQLEKVWILQGCRGKVRRARVSKLQARKEDAQATPPPPCWTHNAFPVPTPHQSKASLSVEKLRLKQSTWCPHWNPLQCLSKGSTLLESSLTD